MSWISSVCVSGKDPYSVKKKNGKKKKKGRCNGSRNYQKIWKPLVVLVAITIEAKVNSRREGKLQQIM